MKEILELDAEILALSNKLSKEKKPTMIKVYEDEIDRKLSKQLDLKHIMERVEIRWI